MSDEIKLTEKQAQILRLFIDTEWRLFLEQCTDMHGSAGTQVALQIVKSLGGDE